MQPRLTRSHTDTMIAGVCGGLGEYFNIDPVIVRLIFVLVTLTSGIGLPIYIILWIVMPKGSNSTRSYTQQSAQQGKQQFHQDAQRLGEQIGQEAAKFGREMREVLRAQSPQEAQRRSGTPGVLSQEPPHPSAYNFDPQTGQPIQRDIPMTGKTINLRVDASETPAQFTPPPDVAPPSYTRPARSGRNWRTLGLILVGIGGLILLEQIGVSMTLVFPALLIAAGIILLRRR